MEKKSGRLFFVQVDVADLSKELLKTLQGKVPGLPFVAKIPSTKSKATRLETAERGVYYTVNEDDVAFAVWVNTHSDAHVRSAPSHVSLLLKLSNASLRHHRSES